MFGVWVKILKFAGIIFYLFKNYKWKSVPDYPILHFCYGTLQLRSYLHLNKEKKTPIIILQKGKSNGPQTVVTICSLVCLHFDESQEWVLI